MIDPQLYKAVFETDRRGAEIFEDLVRRFAQPAVTEGGIDAILKTYHRMGANAVIQHIVRQIDKANGVNDSNDQQENA